MIHEFFKQPHTIGAMEREPISKNRVSPKNDRSRRNLFNQMFAVLFLSLFIFMSCGKDDDSSDPDNNPPVVNPDTPVPAPEGTVTANISSNTEIRVRAENILAGGIGYIRWTEPDNFYLYCSYASGVSICDMGQMRGLGNIANIPQTGYSSPQSYNTTVACESGHGYVVKFEVTDFIYCVRLYVEEPIVSTIGGIMGAKVKYQYPFEPTSLSLSKETLSFASADNGTQTVDINTDATNWTYACTDSWINVNKNEKTLPISVTATEYVSERTGKITVIANEKRKEIAVIQAPILFSLSKETLSFGSIDNGTQTVDINTDATNWTYSCDSWINVNKNGKTLSISVTANEYVLAERIGKITVQVYENQKEITVIQSPITKTSAPYSIGTVYCENGVTGIVYKITDNGYHGMIMSLDEISCQWSANDRYDGINFDNDNDNGMNNMNIIKQLPNWDIRFPAFKWCDDFNKGTVTGWYLPAINELSQVYAGYNDLDTYPGVEDGAYNIYNAERNKFNSVLVGNGGVALSQDRWWWDWYWSSSGDGAAGAYTLSFRNGNQSVYSYTDNHRVRAVRAF